MHNTETFLENRGAQLGPEVRNKLQEGKTALKTRYDGASRDSESRTRQLNTEEDILERLEPDASTFEEWLRGAERSMEKFNREIGSDTDTLRRQVKQLKDFNDDVVGHKGDLKMINVSGQKFVKGADVYRKTLADFRNNVLPRQFTQSFREDPERNLIRDSLNDLNNRYDRLQNATSTHYSVLSDLLDKLTRYKVSVDVMLEWLQINGWKKSLLH